MKLLTPKQVAERLGVCRASVWRYIRKGKLKAIKYTARNFRITEKDLNQFLKKHRTK
jgi:excisionase family DNA binding protein